MENDTIYVKGVGHMRVSLHGGRKGRAKHNDHEFISDHINENDSQYNIYYYGVLEATSCYDAERKIFKKLYSEFCEKQNAKYKKKGQYSRIRTTDDYIENTMYSAREEILQIGDINYSADRITLRECALEYSAWKMERFGNNCKPISMALHMDESTPHVHERTTWFYHDADGVKCPGLDKALREVGIDLPDPTKQRSKTNNRVMTYTALCRAKWQEICKSHGYDIETTPKPSKTSHMESKQYRDYMNALNDIERRETDLNAREQRLNEQAEQLVIKEIQLREKEKELTERMKRVRLTEKQTTNANRITAKAEEQQTRHTNRDLPNIRW